MLGIIGKKIGMTQLFAEDGTFIPVTVIQAGPCNVVQVKTTEKDGYNALQLGFGEIAERKLNRPGAGHFKKQGAAPARMLREFRVDDAGTYTANAEIKVDIFKEKDKVDIRGVTKGKGFQGVVRRWGFHGGRMTHGSMFHRRAGSIGACAYPSETLPGKKMPGHQGNRNKTVHNLEVVRIIPEKNLILIRGAIPGHKNGIVEIIPALKVRVKKGGR